MTAEEEMQKRYQMEVDAARIEAAKATLGAEQQQQFQQQDNTSITKEQLDLSEEITRIDYLLKGYSLEPGAGGKLEWKAPDDDDMKIFTEYGIHLIRNTICWYLNKNLLLSNFDEPTIRKKMWDFTNDLIDTIFMEYDRVFITPTVKQCISALKERIDKQTDISCYAREVSGIEFNKEDVRNEKLEMIEDRIEEELEKIKQQIVKSKLKRFMLIVRVIQDAIHATFMRAFKGEERRTLRQHTHISETRGNPMMTPQQKSGGIWPWGKG